MRQIRREAASYGGVLWSLGAVMNACRWSGCCHIACRYRRCAVLSVADCRIYEIHRDYGVFGGAKYRVGSPAPVTSRLPAERSVAMVYSVYYGRNTPVG